MITTTVRFDDEADITPEEIGLEPTATCEERSVDLGLGETTLATHAKEEALQLAASPFGLGMNLIEEHAQPGDPPAATAAPEQ